MENWQVEHLRFTMFPFKASEINPIEWWNILVDGKPDNINQRIKEGITVIEGNHELGNFSIDINPIRTHFRLFSNLQNKLESQIPVIGDFEPLAKKFYKDTVKLFESQHFPSLSRIAFGTALLLPVEDKIEGYKKLKKYLKTVQIDVEKSSDFLYQINRSRKSKTDLQDLEINRLSKWSVMTSVGSVIRISPKEIKELPESIKELFVATRLELDINTSQNYSEEMDINLLPSIFEELVDLGIEISQKGDIS